MRIQKRTRPASPLGRLCKAVSEGWVWVFGTALFLLFGALMLQTSEEIASSSHSALRTKSIVRHGSLTCAEATRKVVKGEWSDPNRGQIFARETVTLPHFVVSLHNKEYDEVRWKTLMDEGKYYETEVHARFVEILQHQPRSYVLDVGTNIGYYTLLSAALGHDVISFEPNPANILRLCESLRLNEWSHDNVNIFQRAVSDVEGEMTLFVPHNPGQAFLKPLEEGETDDHKAKTQVVTLDNFAEEQGWFDRKDFSITLLKIDVEGKDPQVVLGGSRLLASGLVKNVLSEARRFGRDNVFNSFVTLFEAGFTLKEPAVTMKGTTPKEHAQSVVDYYRDKLGRDSMRTADLWWVKQ